MIVNEQKYRYAKLLQTAKEQANNTVEISDEEAESLGLKNSTPITPVNSGDDSGDNHNKENIKYTIEGIWHGSMNSNYFDRRYGYTTEWTDVQLEFYKDPYVYAEGSGREIDYNGRYYSSVVGFNYIVRNHVIYIDYYDGSHIAIYNYSLWMDKFNGEFHDYYTGEHLAVFHFERIDCGWDNGLLL